MTTIKSGVDTITLVAASAEKGTLYQIQNILNRSGVPTDPGDNLKGAEDFLLVVLHSHIISAAKNILSNSDVQSVTTLVEKIIKNFVRITIPTVVCADSDKSTDQVHTYATELLTLAMLWHNFHDASKEGDGDRLIRCWKFLLLVFKASRRKNYSIEALNLLLQVGHLLSPREAEQVKWSRCINTSGQPGCNMPMDLHMEHLNQ